MIQRLCLSSIVALALLSAASLNAQEYVVGQAAFHIQHAQENCQSINRVLAGFEEISQLETIIGLCQNTPSSTLQFCFTRYAVNEAENDHVSILDGTPMPDASPYWGEPPSYPPGRNVMARRSIFSIIEIVNTGWPICQWAEPPLFADGFEDGTLDAWGS